MDQVFEFSSSSTFTLFRFCNSFIYNSLRTLRIFLDASEVLKKNVRHPAVPQQVWE